MTSLLECSSPQLRDPSHHHQHFQTIHVFQRLLIFSTTILIDSAHLAALALDLSGLIPGLYSLKELNNVLCGAL